MKTINKYESSKSRSDLCCLLLLCLFFSMLSEKKYKSKLCLNPRGTLWTNDENKFGQKLIEKMGWTKGKGLGKEEQGCKEPLRLGSHSRQKGVGYKENADEWTKHYDAFEDVLTNLKGISNPEGSSAGEASRSSETQKASSLELQSKLVRNRVHYKKFTKGKDLSQYNEEDLACILGSKGASKRKKKIKEEEESEAMNTSQGLNTVYGGNLKDYFDKKMDELRKKREGGLIGGGGAVSRDEDGGDSAPITPIPDLEFEPSKTEFSFNLSLPSEAVEEKREKRRKLEEPMEADGEEALQTRKKKKKNKKEKKKQEYVDAEEIGMAEDADEIPVLNESYAVALHVHDKKKKKKKKKKERKEEEAGEDTPKEEGLLRKVKRLRSTLSLTELIRDKSDPEENLQKEGIGDAFPDDNESQTEKKTSRKLTSKRSFKELKTDLEEKVKRKLKKEKKCLETIKEAGDEKIQGTLPPLEKVEDAIPPLPDHSEVGSDFMQVKVRNEDGKMSGETVEVNMALLFPGSNLSTIKGYDRA